MSAFLSFLMMIVVPFGFFGPVEMQLPEEWRVDCQAVDDSGRLLIGCRGEDENHVSQVIILDAAESIDTILVRDERITSVNSICAADD